MWKCNYVLQQQHNKKKKKQSDCYPTIVLCGPPIKVKLSVILDTHVLSIMVKAVRKSKTHV